MLEGLTDKPQIKYSAEADDDMTLHRAVITMRNMYAIRAMRKGPLRKAKERKSAMVVTSTPSAVVTCSHCKTSSRRFEICSKHKGTISGGKTPRTPRKISWCSVHNTGRDTFYDRGAPTIVFCGVPQFGSSRPPPKTGSEKHKTAAE